MGVLKIIMERKRIKKIIGVGGVGKGIFFHSHENTELGRNESRMAVLSGAKDYCKLHIVFHYLGVLLTPEIEIIPIGKVGEDENGYECRRQMKDVGMNIQWLQTSSTRPTMLSVCIQYPDKSGGNITSDNSACQEVDIKYVFEAAKCLGIDKNTMVVALPEVPLEARLELLHLGKSCGAFCVASCGTAEVAKFLEERGPLLCDLIALNQDETAAFADMDRVEDLKEAKLAAKKILTQYPHLNLWLTLGVKGSLLATKEEIIAYSSLPGVQVKNTGGAGDASLAGLLVEFCREGLRSREEKGEIELKRVGELAVLLAGMSVESEDSINQEIKWESIERKKALMLNLSSIID